MGICQVTAEPRSKRALSLGLALSEDQEIAREVSLQATPTPLDRDVTVGVCP